MGAMVVMVCGLAAWSGVDTAAGPPASAPANASLQASPVRRAGTITNLFLPPTVQVTAPVAPTETVSPYAEGVYPSYSEEGVYPSYGSEDWGSEDCHPRCHKHHRRGCWRCCVRSTCDMVPHLWYYPENHGYYYFRPYCYTHVATQQEFIKSVEGDPHSPYADGLFERLYEEMGSAAVKPSAPETK